MTNLQPSVIVCGLIALLTVTLGQISEAREIRTKILQEKLGRLYFSAGKDEDVWPGCKWRVYGDSTDTMQPVCEGKIAESYEGVSISDSMVILPTQLTSWSVARIEAADTASVMITGIASIDEMDKFVIPSYHHILLRYPSKRFASDGKGSRYQEQPSLLFPEDSTRTGVILTPTDHLSNTEEREATYGNEIQIQYELCYADWVDFPSPSPFFVVLIPDVSRPINRNALLTTALRYRIDTSQINNAFEFESVPQLSFLPGTHSYSAFTTDISKAKKLLKENKTTGASVSIDTYSPTLQSTSKFIRGTLTQAGYSTTTVGWNEPADLRLAILPIYSDSPWVALREVLTSISKDTIAKDRANQPVRLADQLLNDALATSDSTRRMQLLERVDRMLMEDIGAFPLFRPIIYVCAKEEIRGIKFDKDGRLDLRSIYRLKLPEDYTEAKK